MSSSKKILIVSLLMFIIGFQILNKTGFLLYFALNRPAIVEKHCVNKAVKTMKCDGKCHLKKYWAMEETQTQEPDSKTPLPKKLQQEKHWNFILPTIAKVISPSYIYTFAKQSESCFQEPKYFIHGFFIFKIFQPPIFC